MSSSGGASKSGSGSRSRRSQRFDSRSNSNSTRSGSGSGNHGNGQPSASSDSNGSDTFLAEQKQQISVKRVFVKSLGRNVYRLAAESGKHEEFEMKTTMDLRAVEYWHDQRGLDRCLFSEFLVSVEKFWRAIVRHAVVINGTYTGFNNLTTNERSNRNGRPMVYLRSDVGIPYYNSRGPKVVRGSFVHGRDGELGNNPLANIVHLSSRSNSGTVTLEKNHFYFIR